MPFLAYRMNIPFKLQFFNSNSTLYLSSFISSNYLYFKSHLLQTKYIYQFFTTTSVSFFLECTEVGILKNGNNYASLYLRSFPYSNRPSSSLPFSHQFAGHRPHENNSFYYFPQCECTFQTLATA